MAKLMRKFQNKEAEVIKENCSLSDFNKLREEARKRMTLEINDFALISGTTKSGQKVMFYLE